MLHVTERETTLHKNSDTKNTLAQPLQRRVIKNILRTSVDVWGGVMRREHD